MENPETTPVNNPVDIDMFNALQADTEAQTTSAPYIQPQHACIKKCLHPPSAVPSYEGLCTNDARSQVNIEWRNMEVMNRPIIYDSSIVPNVYRYVDSADLEQFDLAMLIPTGARVKSIGFIFNRYFNSMQQDYNNVAIEQLYNFQNWRYDANLYRPTYKSTTLSLNATAFNNTGMVAGNQFNPAILFAGTLIDFSLKEPAHFYDFVRCEHTRKSINVHQTRPNEDIVSRWENFPAYIRNELCSRLKLNPTAVLDLDPNTTIQVINFNRTTDVTGSSITIVPTNSQILGQSMRGFGGKATEGAFSINRLNTVSPRWLAASNTHGGEMGLYRCYFFVKGNDDSSHFVPFLDNTPPGPVPPTTNYLYDTLWSEDMTWSWVRFSGLSLNSQTSVSTQLLIRKFYSGYEIQPTMTSAWAGMTKFGPKPDLKAMEAMMDGFFELKDVLPARYNFWGTLGSIAAQGLSTFGSSLLKNLVGGNKSSKSDKRKDKPRAIRQRDEPVYSEPNTRNMQRAPRPRTRAPAPAVEASEVHDTNVQVHNLSKKLDKMVVSKQHRSNSNGVAPKRRQRSRAPSRNRQRRN